MCTLIGGRKDSMFLYVCELLTIWWNYYDALKEGDGERVLKIWKYYDDNFQGKKSLQLC